MLNQEEIMSNIITKYITEIPTIIHKKIYKKDIKYEYRNEYYEIREKIDKFIEKEETHKRFLVLPGIRGVGKTTILYQIYEYIFKEKNIPLNQILYLSCDDINNAVECNLRKLIELYLDNYHNTTPRLLNKKIFLLIDEAQYDKNWSQIGKMLFDKTENIFMIFTGSSALNLEVTADSKRRYKKIIIPPLTYSHHLKLKYNLKLDTTANHFKNLLDKWIIEDFKDYEFDIKTKLTNTLNYTENDWMNYIYYGGYPINFDETDILEITDNLVETVEKVIDTDMKIIKNISEDNQVNANRTIRYLAIANSNETSMNKISTYLNTSISNVKIILETLEKTQIIFHCEAHGTSSKRTRKSWKYYFATSSLKNALLNSIGNTNTNKAQHEGILLENFVASKLHQFTKYNKAYTLYYDSNKKENVDFILQKEFGHKIPIEIGRGKKDKKQIKKAINNYKSEYGIIISNKTQQIEKEDNVIRIPPKTFALL